MKIIAVTQARVGSSRLPRKILKTVGDKTLLEIHLERLQQSKQIGKLIVATTEEPDSILIADIAQKCGVKAFHGSTDNVLDRFYQAVKQESPDYIVRLTSDCPLIDPVLVDAVISFALKTNVDYVSNTLKPLFPDGQDVEVIRFGAFVSCWENARLTSELEHVTPYIWKNSSFFGQSLFSSENFAGETDHSHIRLTVDEQKDLDTITALAGALGLNATWQEYTAYYIEHIAGMSNSNIARNEGYKKSLSADKND